MRTPNPHLVLTALAAVALLHDTINWDDLALLVSAWERLIAPIILRLTTHIGPADVVVCVLYLCYARHVQAKAQPTPLSARGQG